MMNKQLLLGDCLDRLKELPDNSIDSIVTDPPYGLSFMGKKWDYDVPSTEIWKECFRVLKPGGHLLSFGGSRTYHRLAVNVEDAGFEIRDQIQWIYGSGFPKSHNIGKAVDKKLGNEREVVGEKMLYDTHHNPTQKQNDWDKKNVDITKGTSEWEGWGTALKPAHEPIVMARKPLSEKTIVENVLKHGTGGINIDESRIPFVDEDDMNRSVPGGKVSYRSGSFGQQAGLEKTLQEKRDPNQQGRFPANIILSEEAAENLDGHQKDTSRYFYVVKPSKKEKEFGMMGEDKVLNRVNSGGIENDPKWAPTVRKNNHPTVKPIKLMEYLIKLVTPVGGTTLDPFMGSGTTGIAVLTNGFNFVGIEMGEEYMDIAQQRIDAWTKEQQTKMDI
jgi:site-specific DNA-methyltransferase (adenine-specific)